MADETMHDSLLISATNTGIAKGTSVRAIGAARGVLQGHAPPKIFRT